MIPAAYASMDYHSLSSPVVQEKVVVVPDRDCFIGTKRDVMMDALLLCEKSERYSNAVFEYPVEIGGEISGVIKSRWRNKPIENAKINIIAPSIGLATEAKTDSDGRFLVDGFDWPEETAFVCQAIGPKGQKEHNFTIESDSFPEIKPILMRYDVDYEQDYKTMLDRIGKNTILLEDVLVTAPYTSGNPVFRSGNQICR